MKLFIQWLVKYFMRLSRQFHVDNVTLLWPKTLELTSLAKFGSAGLISQKFVCRRYLCATEGVAKINLYIRGINAAKLQGCFKSRVYHEVRFLTV